MSPPIKSRSKEGGEVITFHEIKSELDILMTTSKKTKLGKGGRGGGGEHPGTPPLAETLKQPVS